jgi:hypothetical protein
MEIIPRTFEGIERSVMLSILTVLGGLLFFDLIEHTSVQSLTIQKMNETEERIAAYALLSFVVFCTLRAIYLKIQKRKNCLLYVLGIPLGSLTLIHLGAVIQ